MNTLERIRARAEAQVAKHLNKEQSLAEEIWIYFGKKIPFARIMADIKTKGYQWIFRCYQETKKANVLNPIALFLWKIKQVKIIKK